MKIIEITNVVKTYTMGETRVQALDGITFDVEAGEFLAVMGPSGSGKSTLMNILGCLDRPTSGSYKLDGIEIASMDRDRRAEIRNDKIGFVFQSFNLLPRTSALENVELPLLYSNKRAWTDQQMMERAKECLGRVGLQGREDHTPSQLSGGQQQRVAIARALINDPAIVLADEPTGNLDSRTSEEIMEVFRRLNDEGKLVIVITHEPDIAEKTRRIITMRDGQVVTDRPIEQRVRA